MKIVAQKSYLSLSLSLSLYLTAFLKFPFLL